MIISSHENEVLKYLKGNDIAEGVEYLHNNIYQAVSRISTASIMLLSIMSFVYIY